MFRRNRYDTTFGDTTTDELVSAGVYSLHRPGITREKRWFKGKEHNILSGMQYVFILSCLLWWLPIFGQMIAGYIGGRKAGSPIKGIFVTVIPALIILLLIVGMDIGLLPFLGIVAAIPNMIINGTRALSPHAGYLLSETYNSLKPVMGLDGSGFAIIVVFGLIGGMMADMNRKEIVNATGNMHFYDAFLDRFSGRSLNKFADMVAERVIWTLGTIDYCGRNLMGKMHHEPKLIGFGELKKLPPAPTSQAPSMQWSEETLSTPEKAYGWDSLSPRYEDVTSMKNADSWDSRAFGLGPEVRRQERTQEQKPSVIDQGLGHRYMNEEANVRHSKEHLIKIHGRNHGEGNRFDVKNRSDRFYRNNDCAKKTEEKRDAVIYDSKGKLMNTHDLKKRAENILPKRKQPPLIARALAADKEIKAKSSKETQQTGPPKPEKVEKEEKARRVKPERTYDRL